MAWGWTAGLSLKRFQVKWVPVRVRKRVRTRNMEIGSDPIRTKLQPRKLQNFGRRSYCFAAIMGVFHPLDGFFTGHPQPSGITALARKHRCSESVN
jgi:hypothetical protein